jgi:hypothetical protein
MHFFIPVARWSLYKAKDLSDPLVVVGFSPRRPGFNAMSDHVGFVADEVLMGQVFPEFFCVPCQYPFHVLQSPGAAGGPTSGRRTKRSQSRYIHVTREATHPDQNLGLYATRRWQVRAIKETAVSVGTRATG